MAFIDYFRNLTPASRRGSTTARTVERGGASWLGTYEQGGEFDVNPDLSGLRKYASYHAIRRRVPVAAAYWRLVKSLAQRAVFTIDSEDERTEFVFGPLSESWSRAKGVMAEAMMVGFSAQEWTSVERQGRYALSSVRRIPPGTIHRFELDRQGRVDGFAQHVDGREVVLPRWKAFYVCDGVPPEGDGTLADVADDALTYLRHKRLMYGASGANLRDVPDFRLDGEARAAKAPFVEAVDALVREKNRRANPRVVLPSDVQTVQGNQGQDVPVSALKNEAVPHPPVPIADNNLLMDLSKDMAVALGVQSLLLGQDGAGSLALARVEAQTLHSRMNGVLAMMASEMQRVFALLWTWNGWDAPNVTVDTSGWRDPVEMADLLSKLNGVDAERYGAAVDDVLTQAGLPLADDGGSVAGQGEGEDE